MAVGASLRHVACPVLDCWLSDRPSRPCSVPWAQSVQEILRLHGKLEWVAFRFKGHICFADNDGVCDTQRQLSWIRHDPSPGSRAVQGRVALCELDDGEASRAGAER